MEAQKDSIEALLAELNKNSGNSIVTAEDFKRAEKEINEKMAVFSIEQRAYFNRSIQSASRAYLTF